jgi:hypothetical protein
MIDSEVSLENEGGSEGTLKELEIKAGLARAAAVATLPPLLLSLS